MSEQRAVRSAQEGLASDPGQLSEASGWDVPVDLAKEPAVIPELSETDIPRELQLEIEGYMERYPDHHSATLPALAAAQRLHGWCSPLAMRQVAAVMRVTPAYLSSVATFYDMLNTNPVGRHYVYVCTSVACHPKNAKRIYDELAEAGADLDDWHIREFECLGACEMAPMASFDGRYVGPITSDDVPTIIDALRNGEQPLPGRGLTDEGFRLPWEAGANSESRIANSEEPPEPPSTGAA